MLGVLRNRDFALLWWGGLVSMLGNWMLSVALPVYVYGTTGSTLATAIMFIAGALPRVLLGTVAGVFVDRWRRKRTMVVCNLLLALTLTPLLLVETGGATWPIYLVAFIQSSVGQFFGPAENALLPTLVGKEQLTPANALNALNNNLARLLGPAAGGLMMASYGLTGVVLVNVASYLVAAALIALLSAAAGTASRREPPTTGSALRRWASEWREGLSHIRGNRVTRMVLAVLALTSLGEGTFSVLLAPFVREVFAGGALELGWVLSAQAVGGVAGGLVIGWVGRCISPFKLLGFGSLFIGLFDLAIFNYPALLSAIWFSTTWFSTTRFSATPFPALIPALVLMVLVGVPASGFGAGYTTLVQTNVANKLLGRVFGTISTVSALTMLAGMAAAGVLGDLAGVVPVINTQGVVYVLAGVLVLVLWRPRRVVNPREAKRTATARENSET